MTKKIAVESKITACACSEYEIGLTIDGEDGDQPEVTAITTGCTATTRRTFAAGHDARLKSLLIRAGVEGLEVRWGRGVLHIGDPIGAANSYGFAHMVRTGIERGLAKLEAKAAKAAAPKAPRASKKDKAAAAERAAALTEKMAQVAAKVTVATESAPVAEPTTEAPAGTVQIRLGRWTYAATIVDGDAHYSDAKGVARVALEGNYKHA